MTFIFFRGVAKNHQAVVLWMVTYLSEKDGLIRPSLFRDLSQVAYLDLTASNWVGFVAAFTSGSYGYLVRGNPREPGARAFNSFPAEGEFQPPRHH